MSPSLRLQFNTATIDEDSLGSVMASKLDEQTFTSEFDSHLVPLSKKLSKLLLVTKPTYLVRLSSCWVTLWSAVASLHGSGRVCLGPGDLSSLIWGRHPPALTLFEGVRLIACLQERSSLEEY